MSHYRCRIKYLISRSLEATNKAFGRMARQDYLVDKHVID